MFEAALIVTDVDPVTFLAAGTVWLLTAANDEERWGVSFDVYNHNLAVTS